MVEKLEEVKVREQSLQVEIRNVLIEEFKRLKGYSHEEASNIVRSYGDELLKTTLEKLIAGSQAAATLDASAQIAAT